MALRGLKLGSNGARWEDEVYAALPDGEAVFCSAIADYQGDGAVVARLDCDGWLFFEWSYGSCSGCDQWEDQEDQIPKDVASGMQKMDAETMAEFLVQCRATNARWLAGDKWEQRNRAGDIDEVIRQCARDAGR